MKTEKNPYLKCTKSFIVSRGFSYTDIFPDQTFWVSERIEDGICKLGNLNGGFRIFWNYT